MNQCADTVQHHAASEAGGAGAPGAGAPPREPRPPRVGIWWVLPDGRLVEFSREFVEDPDHLRGNAHGPLDHWSAWDHVRQAHPEVADRDWAEVPRGRVLMRAQGGRSVFVIVTSRELANDGGDDAGGAGVLPAGCAHDHRRGGPALRAARRFRRVGQLLRRTTVSGGR